MGINALLLGGWDETSTWGYDQGTLYAQLTPNGVPDDDGPQIWITRPKYVVDDVVDLAHAIAAATRAPLSDVVLAMRLSFGPDYEVLDVPEPEGPPAPPT